MKTRNVAWACRVPAIAIGLFLSILLSSPSEAGTATHGGSVVICREMGELREVRFLDLFEGELQGRMGLQASASFQETLDFAIDRAKKIAPGAWYLHMALDEGVKAALQLLWFVPGVESVPDSGPITPLPQGCRVAQIATYDYRSQILIDQGLWNDLSNRDRAALILHEVLFAVQRSVKLIPPDTNYHSTSTRELVSLLLTPSTNDRFLRTKIMEFINGFEGGIYADPDRYEVSFRWDPTRRKATATLQVKQEIVCGGLQREFPGTETVELFYVLRTGQLVTLDRHHFFQIAENGQVRSACGMLQRRGNATP